MFTRPRLKATRLTNDEISTLANTGVQNINNTLTEAYTRVTKEFIEHVAEKNSVDYDVAEWLISKELDLTYNIEEKDDKFYLTVTGELKPLEEILELIGNKTEHDKKMEKKLLEQTVK